MPKYLIQGSYSSDGAKGLRKDGGSKRRQAAEALIKEAGLQKGQIGKIDVRETFSLVDIASAAVDQAVRRLTGVSIRGRRVSARPDRT